MNPPLIDTPILIDVLRKRVEAETYILDTTPQNLCTHDTVVAEILMGVRDGKELAAVDRFLQPFQILHLTEVDSARAIELLHQFKLSHGTGYLDCLIAATALRLNMPVATTNDKHFRPIPNLQVIRPY
jgi:hypothetical protein